MTTVAELIALLQQQEQDTEVAIGYEGTHNAFHEIYVLDETWANYSGDGTPFMRNPRLVVVATR